MTRSEGEVLHLPNSPLRLLSETEASFSKEMRELSRQELRRYNGKNSAPAYIAFNGKVYDVSPSFLWRKGNHQVFHDAGLDLTAELKQAPHGEDLIEKFFVVGVLRED